MAKISFSDSYRNTVTVFRLVFVVINRIFFGLLRTKKVNLFLVGGEIIFAEV